MNKSDRFTIIREYIYGWDWGEFGENGGIITYATRKEAQDELNDYIEETNHEYEKGHISSPYDDDCAIALVTIKDGMAYSDLIDEPYKINDNGNIS